ncbi:hypothetical protein SISSUDRAFT_1051982 [Sistotremastrum suecicum HHB10207 ss-3]|uniref:Uncharacterized protein n=1 Tax=Sistotremastrum suecicum HHB10207 ss-3 TaxID=1314776 RepID=A0A166A7C7_9AGAM|nr:hypothetical protein SISSUDRAFT_1051982 [Sistotremastrum suecicum HHB10207 ss-3]
MSSSYLFLLFVVHVVSCKAIYDIHASDRANTSEPFAIQRPRLASNGQVLAGGLKRLQPPRSISRAIVKAKKERSNPVDTAPMAKRSNVPTIAYIKPLRSPYPAIELYS